MKNIPEDLLRLSLDLHNFRCLSLRSDGLNGCVLHEFWFVVLKADHCAVVVNIFIYKIGLKISIFIAVIKMNLKIKVSFDHECKLQII